MSTVITAPMWATIKQFMDDAQLIGYEARQAITRAVTERIGPVKDLTVVIDRNRTVWERDGQEVASLKAITDERRVTRLFLEMPGEPTEQMWEGYV